MTQSLLTKRLSFAVTLSLLLSAVGHNNAGIAQAKDTVTKSSTRVVELSGDECAGRMSSFAHRPGGHGFMPPGPPPFGFMDGLPGPPGAPPPSMTLPLAGVDLSDDQIEKLAQLNTSFMEQTGPAIFKLHALESQFRLALSASSLNMDDLNGLRSKISAQRVQVDTATGDFAIAQAQTLTPEQRHQVKLEIERFELSRAFGPHPGPHE